MAGEHMGASRSLTDLLDAMDRLDEIIHQKARLGIMSALAAHNEVEFRFLKELLGLSDGNLAAHVGVLEARGYLVVTKEFVAKRPRTTYSLTERGRTAFKQYLTNLESVVRGASE